MSALDVYKASINVRVNGVNTLQTMHFQQLDDEGPEFPPDSLQAAIETQLVPVWKPMLSNDTVITSVSIKRILPTPDQPSVYPIAGGTGTVAQEAEPPNLAVVATIYSDNNDRRGRNRTYFSGIAQTLIQGAIPTAAFVSLFSTFKATWLSAMTGTGFTVRWALVQYSPSDDTINAVIHVEQRMQLRVLRSRISN